jgi:hypothetical protein
LTLFEDKFAGTSIDEKPYVLKEGIAGNICYLSDLLCGEKHVKFPAYEI